jgi:uncharacterized membrane protein
MSLTHFYRPTFTLEKIDQKQQQCKVSDHLVIEGLCHMNSILARRKSFVFLVIIVFLHFVVYVTVFFNIPIARQVVGFLYFSFVPGFVVIKLLKMNELNRLETILFSVGLSIALLMLVGLLVNESGLLLGISRPLSLTPLLIVFNSLVLVGGVLVYLRNEPVNLSIQSQKSLFALFFVGLPILSVLGAMWVNVYGSNLILLFMIIAVVLLFAVGISSEKLLRPKFYFLAVLMIAIAVLFHSVLISRYLVNFGSDIDTEWFVFETVKNNQYWSSVPIFSEVIYNRLNSMLSVTILPTIYSTLLNIDGTQMFKILFPLLFSFTPLALYQMWQKNFGKKMAFAAAFLFIAQTTFYTEMIGLARQMIAELFFVLLLLIIVNERVKPLNKIICFTIFSIALITSHYALAEIFLFFISFALISLVILKRPHRDVNVGMVLLFFALMFTWYIYTSGSSVFDSFVSYGNNVRDQLGDFLNPASRGATVLMGLGIEEVPSIWNAISRAFAYVTEALVVVGLVGLILKRVRINVKTTYIMFSLAAMILLGALLIVPGLANTLNMTRFYHILLFLLAPFCAIGAEVVAKLVPRLRKETAISIVLLIVLIPYFLFQTGFVYEVTNTESWSLSLSMRRMNGYMLYFKLGYVDDFSVFAARWMHTTRDIPDTQLYADIASGGMLMAYGSVYGASITLLSNATSVSTNAIVFLSPLNTIYKTIVTYSYPFNSDQLPFLDNINVVYTNGGSEICAN